MTGHLGTKMGRRGVEEKRCHLATKSSQVAEGTDFQDNEQVLDRADNLNYLGRIFSSEDRDWPVVHTNLQRAQRKWGRFYQFLGCEGADTRTSGRFYMWRSLSQ